MLIPQTVSRRDFRVLKISTHPLQVPSEMDLDDSNVDSPDGLTARIQNPKNKYTPLQVPRETDLEDSKRFMLCRKI